MHLGYHGTEGLLRLEMVLTAMISLVLTYLD